MLVFHGTSRWSWEKTENSETNLYVSISREDAESYAERAAEYDCEDGLTYQPILVFLELDRLPSHFELLPDEATVQSFGLPEPATWQDTMRASGSFVIYGHIDSLKAHATIENLLRGE